MMNFKDYLKETFSRLGISHVFGSWEETWVESGGIRLFVTVFRGRAEGGDGQRVRSPATVVFIPGTSVYALCYAELMFGLAQAGLNVVGFDPRGQGQSGGGRGDYTIMEHVENAASVVEYARSRFGDPIFVMGSSQGGIEAFYLAATPIRLAGAICHNLAVLPHPESIRLTRFGPGKRRVRRQGQEQVSGSGSPRNASEQSAEVPGYLVVLSRVFLRVLSGLARLFPRLPVPISAYLDLRAEPIRGFGNAWNFIEQDPLCLRHITLRAMASIATTPLPRPLSQITTPLLALHSSEDNIFPTDYIVNIFNQLTCEKELKVFEGLPHLITLEYVPQVLPVVVEWINSRLA